MAKDDEGKKWRWERKKKRKMKEEEEEEKRGEKMSRRTE